MMRRTGNIGKGFYNDQLAYQTWWVQKIFFDFVNRRGSVDAAVLMGHGYKPNLMSNFFTSLHDYVVLDLKITIPVLYLYATDGVDNTRGVKSNFRGYDTFYELSVSGTIQNDEAALKLVINTNDVASQDEVFKVILSDRVEGENEEDSEEGTELEEEISKEKEQGQNEQAGAEEGIELDEKVAKKKGKNKTKKEEEIVGQFNVTTEDKN
eukprot:5887134-Ditylum_brightwellii.AAC.1